MLSVEQCHVLTEASENQQEEPELETLNPPAQAATLSGKQRRALLKKERRKRKRQALAKRRSLDQPETEQEQDEEGGDEVDKGVEERQRLHQEWLERERVFQEEFRLKKEKEEAARRKKEEEEKRIKEEWEEQERKEREEREQKQQEKRDRETKERVTDLQVSSTEENEAVQKMLDLAESQLENGGSWKNPDAPADYGTEKDKANCPFFLKTGSCRFGERCSRKHDHPVSSSTLMIRGMFVTFGMEQSKRDDYDTDASLEYSEEEVYQQFMDFYEDVLPEFRNAGKVVQFKVSCNFEPHLRGNVYVQYDTEDQCKEAFVMFNGRWYAGKQLQCEFSPVTRWKTAICGLFDRQKCPKGKHCNFLHVFRNPGNEFWEADRDLHLSPDRGGGFTGWHSERRDRMFSQRSYSPERSHYRRSDRRSHSREKYTHRRRRSNSRERRSRSRSRESWRSQRSQRRGQGSFSDRYRRSRSRERHKSCSRDKDSGHISLANSRKRTSRRSESNSPGEESKKGSVKKKSRKNRSRSPNTCDAASTDTAVTPSHHHKRSKKNKKKKKSKKKQKRKKSRSHSGSSSACSSKESEEEEDVGPVNNQDKQSTEMPTEDSKTDSLTVLQENNSSNSQQQEDEILSIPDVTSSNNDNEPDMRVA